MTSTPLTTYLLKCQQGEIEKDSHQLAVMEAFDRVFHQLNAERDKRRFLSWFRRKKRVKGLYIWGGVGLGKTFMMDCFYHCIPFDDKMRMHFHQFIAMIQEQLKLHQGEKNPIDHIVRELAETTDVLCLDEFIVKDIVDAMLLERLLTALFKYGVCVMMTSNTEPDRLYERGLQRHSFLPAIALIKNEMEVIHLASQKDYRMAYIESAGVYYTPDNASSAEQLGKAFELLSHHQPVSEEPLTLFGRTLPVMKRTEDCVWFDFDVICRPPRSQLDYLEISRQFTHVFISHVPVISPAARDTIALFIKMIDVFYDARTRLVMSAAGSVDALYKDGSYAQDYQRTRSRLMEMQSSGWYVEK